MNCPVVSFCIATFQRYEILKELIEEILSVDSDKIEVTVCDDKSLDGSIEKIMEIKDPRLKIYVNEENVGSSLNIHDSLDKGTGEYLFYVNDRDNVDAFKIRKLLEILEELKKENVAFAKCSREMGNIREYRIFSKGREALCQFACRIDHPTGYIFKRDVWKKIRKRRILFENQAYGDYPITQICAIMAKKYKGALIYGDICDVLHYRIDFSKVKSGYYIKRKDKRLWYSPEVMSRELLIGQTFLKKIKVQADIREQILIDRYREYLSWCVTAYKDMITDPTCTAHYNLYPRQDFFSVFSTSVKNGIKLWNKTVSLCIVENEKVISQINKATYREYGYFLKNVLENEFHVNRKAIVKLQEKEYEIIKREIVLNTYERWADTLIEGLTISEYLLKNKYYHVAIYGMGRIGRHLYKELQDSDVTVDFVIDQQISVQTRCYKDVSCFNSKSEFPDTDLIIVTVSGETDGIIAELRKKVKEPVKSINDILFVMN